MSVCVLKLESHQIFLCAFPHHCRHTIVQSTSTGRAQPYRYLGTAVPAILILILAKIFRENAGNRIIGKWGCRNRIILEILNWYLNIGNNTVLKSIAEYWKSGVPKLNHIGFFPYIFVIILSPSTSILGIIIPKPNPDRGTR